MLFRCQSFWSKCEGKMREGIKGGSAARTGRQWRRRARRRARGERGKKEQRGKGLSARNSRITLPVTLTAARNSSATGVYVASAIRGRPLSRLNSQSRLFGLCLLCTWSALCTNCKGSDEVIRAVAIRVRFNYR